MIASKNLKSQVLSRCEHLVTVRNKYTGQLVRVPCGECKTCILNGCSKYSRLCSIEESQYKYCYFVGLSYAPEYLPTMKLVSSLVPVYKSSHIGRTEYLKDTNPELYDCYDYKYKKLAGSEAYEVLYSFQCDTPRCDCYGQSLTHLSKTYPVGVPVPDSVLKLLQKCDDGNKLPFLYYKDLQLFLKRVRKYATKYNITLRYFAVGEYGPMHYRPHWHIIFYSDSEQVPEVLEQIVRKSWRFGRVDYSASRGSVSSYLAGYVNSTVDVPSLFKAKSIRPRCFHSFYFGFKIFEKDKQEIYERGLEYFTSKVHLLYGKHTLVRPFDRIRSFLFPKCIGYSEKTFHELYGVYTFYRRVQRAFPFVSDRKRLRFLRELSDGSDPYFPDSPVSDCFIYNRVTLINYVRSQVRECNLIFYDNVPEWRYRFIYSLFWISRHFCRFVCDDDGRLFRPRLRQIVKFYDDLDKQNLHNWYSAQSEYSVREDCYIPFYDNPYKLYSDDFDYDIAVKGNSVFCHQLNVAYERFDKSIKHKQLNDANDMFNNQIY